MMVDNKNLEILAFEKLNTDDQNIKGIAIIIKKLNYSNYMLQIMVEHIIKLENNIEQIPAMNPDKMRKSYAELVASTVSLKQSPFQLSPRVHFTSPDVDQFLAKLKRSIEILEEKELIPKTRNSQNLNLCLLMTQIVRIRLKLSKEIFNL